MTNCRTLKFVHPSTRSTCTSFVDSELWGLMYLPTY